MRTPLPDWYSPAMAEQDRLHDGVAWRCREHGLLTAQYVLILGHVAYCGSCALGDGKADPIPLVSQPRCSVTQEHWNGRAPRRRALSGRSGPPAPKAGTMTAMILEAVRAAGADGVRHGHLVLRFGEGSRPCLRSLAKRGFVVRVEVGVWVAR